MDKEQQIKEMSEDLIEIFDEEYNKRYVITPQNTARKLTEKGYCKASEIFEELEREIKNHGIAYAQRKIAELKKKYTESENNDR